MRIDDIKIRTIARKKSKAESLDLQVANYPTEGTLILMFNRENFPIFKIIITDGKMSFERHVSRPDHDHDSNETLLRNSKGELYWSRDPLNEEEGEEKLKIPFGSITD